MASPDTDANPQIPHLAYPFRLTPSGQFAVVEQDLLNDVRQSVFIAARTLQGSRPASPESGIPDPTFAAGIDGDVLASMLEQQEPRARVSVTVTDTNTGERRIEIDVSLAAESAA